MKNKIFLEDGHAVIEVRARGVKLRIKIDEEDILRVCDIKWRLLTPSGFIVSGQHPFVTPLHKFLLNTVNIVKFKNGDKLDYRKANLTIVRENFVKI